MPRANAKGPLMRNARNASFLKVVAATLNGVSHEPAQSMASGDLAAVPPPQIA